MTLSTSEQAVSVGNSIYAYSPRIDFSAGSSGEERVALNFTSPNDFFYCTLNVSLDTGSMAHQDIIAIIFRGNGETIYQAKWTLGDPTNFGEPQSIYPLNIILPPNTVFKAVLAFQSGTAMVGTGSFILVGNKLG
tara:strand:+ start:21 stop:425 length:405 start_codon:yes stop_codon:yes gene_type:complete